MRPAYGRSPFFLLLLIGVTACASQNAGAGSGQSEEDVTTTIVQVIDGDSVELEINGTVFESRLIGINAPEFGDCQGPSARDALVDVAGDEVLTAQTFGTDRFGRLLVELQLDNASINGALVRAGWALALHSDGGRMWLNAMELAAKDGLGMWDLPELCERPQVDVVISAMEPDPAGPDNDVLEDEWIEIHNRGADAVDLKGWMLRDESSSNRFVFEGGFLDPGQRLRVRTGCGQDSASDIYWCSSNGVWSNRGETALLLSPSGAIVDHMFVG